MIVIVYLTLRLQLWLLLFIDDSVEKRNLLSVETDLDRNTSAMQLFKLNKNVLKAKQYVINLSKSKLTYHDYILLSRGLKFIPNPEDKNTKLELLKDFDELTRTMRCRYWFHKHSDKLHPCYQKTGYEPGFNCHTLGNNHLTWGVLWFFLNKYSDSQCC